MKSGGLSLSTICLAITAVLLCPSQFSGATIEQQHFINAVYIDLLGRPVDPIGLATFSALLDGGGTTVQVALGVLNGQEYRVDLVNSFFQSYLNRPADPLSLSTYVGALNGGATDEMVQVPILGSDEYFLSRGGNSNQGYLNALFPDLLNRPPDQASIDTFLSLLGSGGTRSQVAGILLGSAEYDTLLVTGYYFRFLRRAPDAAGLNAFVSELQSPNNARDEQVIAQILGSEEYFRVAQTVPEPATWTLLVLGSGLTLLRRRRP